MDATPPTLLPTLAGTTTSGSLQRAMPGTGAQTTPEQAAIDFESVFASILLKEMRNTLEPGSLFGNDSGDVYGGLFDLFLGQHMGRSGALGIARMVNAYLETRQQAPVAEGGLTDDLQ